jgi:hypothetical protein
MKRLILIALLLIGASALAQEGVFHFYTDKKISVDTVTQVVVLNKDFKAKFTLNLAKNRYTHVDNGRSQSYHVSYVETDTITGAVYFIIAPLFDLNDKMLIRLYTVVPGLEVLEFTTDEGKHTRFYGKLD